MPQFPREGTKYRLILTMQGECTFYVLLCREIAWGCFYAIKGVIQNIKKNN